MLRLAWRTRAWGRRAWREGVVRSVHGQSGAAEKGLKAVFFGSDGFSVPVLRALEGAVETGVLASLDVVVPRSKGAGRGAVAAAAAAAQLPVWVPPKRTTLRGWALPETYDVGVVASFGYFIPPEIIAQCALGMINVHPSDLPRHRGPAPLYRTILDGDRHSAVCIIDVSPDAFDVGAVLARSRIDLAAHPTLPFPPAFDDLSLALATEGGRLAVHTLANWDASVAAALPQDTGGPPASHAPKVTKDEAIVAWDAVVPLTVVRMWAAFGSSLGVNTFAPSGKRIKLLDIAVHPPGAPPGALPGHVSFDKSAGALVVACADGAVAVGRVQVEGKAVARARDYANSHLQRPGGDTFVAKPSA